MIHSSIEQHIENIEDNPSQEASTGTLKVGITEGDINGVGIELILRTFEDPEMLNLCTPIIYGHKKVLLQHRKTLGLNTPFRQITTPENAISGQLNLINVSDADYEVEFGKASVKAGLAAKEALSKAVEDLKSGAIDVLVTCPINKATVHSDEFPFSGHTEYLQTQLPLEGSEALMILFSKIMRVALVSTHQPISEVPYAITEERVQRKARILFESLKKDFNISCPRIAVLSLNPHCGDNGLLGNEEKEIIAPAIKALSETGVTCFGPYAADGFFGAALYRHFDGVLAMYHDQGLIPLKTLSMSDGVNFTAGLSAIRTSPDHGVAYDIAGKGIADIESFRQSIFSAMDIWKNRNFYNTSRQNPLPKLYLNRKER